MLIFITGSGAPDRVDYFILSLRVITSDSSLIMIMKNTEGIKKIKANECSDYITSL